MNLAQKLAVFATTTVTIPKLKTTQDIWALSPSKRHALSLDKNNPIAKLLFKSTKPKNKSSKDMINLHSGQSKWHKEEQEKHRFASHILTKYMRGEVTLPDVKKKEKLHAALAARHEGIAKKFRSTGGE